MAHDAKRPSAGEITVVAHSMGGLVARSACHSGAGTRRRSKLRTLVTLGTPHHGAPVERAGNIVDALLPGAATARRSRWSATSAAPPRAPAPRAATARRVILPHLMTAKS